MSRRGMVLLFATCLSALAALAIAPGPAHAQWGDYDDAPQYDPYASSYRRRARNADRAPVRRYAPQEAPRQYFWPWEERPQQAQPQPQRQQPAPRTYGRSTRPRSPAVASRSRGSVTSAPTVATDTPPVAKTTPNIQVAVFGDSLASYLSKGLDAVFEDNADVEVIDKSRGDSGIVRKDVVDWPKTAEEYLKANPKTAYALMMIGVNDRQTLREGDQSYEPLTDKWREIYIARIDALVKVFVDQKVPLIWVDVPPVRFENMNKDLAAINEIVRERIQKAGQTYVDIWPGFVDDKNRFAFVGPDLDGQQAKLRAYDGIHFTNAGARKLAHFADVELKRLMGANGTPPAEQPAAVATTPGPGPVESAGTSLDDTSAIDRKNTAMLPSQPEPPGIPSLPVKPAAGPVVPLGRIEMSPGGALLSGRLREGDPSGTVERVIQRGVAPISQPGRADDFKWPPG